LAYHAQILKPQNDKENNGIFYGTLKKLGFDKYFYQSDADNKYEQVVAKASKFEDEKYESVDVLQDQMILHQTAEFLAKKFNDASNLKKNQTLHYVDLKIIQVQLVNSKTILNYSIEPYLKGNFAKWSGSLGAADVEIKEEIKENDNDSKKNSNSEILLLAQSFSHFTYEYTKHKLMVVDVQGAKVGDQYLLTDPVIHSIQIEKFSPTNLGNKGMNQFMKNHCCNKFCNCWKNNLNQVWKA